MEAADALRRAACLVFLMEEHVFLFPAGACTIAMPFRGETGAFR